MLTNIPGLVLTLAPTLVTAAVLLTGFLILRRSNRRWYAPRTYLGSLREYERTPELPKGIFSSIKAFVKMPDATALRHQSLDAYLFLRFLRVCFTIAAVGVVITWPVLFPVNATGGNGQTQLELLSWSNIDTSRPEARYRLFAHAFIAWIFLGFVLYTILRECIYFINLRQAFMLTPQNARRISSRTVLFTCVPTPYLDVDRLRKIFGESVKHIWLAHDTELVDDYVKERNKVAIKLENAEVKLLRLVNGARIKAAKKGGATATTDDANNNAGATPPRDGETETGDIADRWVPRSKRPTHRMGFLGLFGQKVDTIDWCREELQKLVPHAENAQQHYRAGGYAKVSAVFIEFHTQSDAQAAYQIITHHQALHMAPKYIGVKPEEVVWKSLKYGWMAKLLRTYLVVGFIAALIVFWAIPVAIVGVISQVSTLVKIPFLTWLNDLPKEVLGLIGGLLPPILMNLLFSLVPVIMRLCGRLSGEVSLSNVELFTQKAYFVFMLIQLFLVRTLGDTASTLIVQISQDPGNALRNLSQSLPTSSNFYISYFLVQGFAIAASVVTQITGLFVFRILYKLLASTPRSMYEKWTSLSAISWGSLMPLFTNMAVISIVFAIIAPLELFFAALAMALFYLAYRYNIFFVTTTNVDTRGMIYATALTQLFSGVYIAEVCLIGLFAVSEAWGPLVLLIAFLVVTILVHAQIKRALYPLMFSLPRNILMEEESDNVDLEGTVGVDPGHAAGSSSAAGPSAPVPIPDAGRDGAIDDGITDGKVSPQDSSIDGKTAAPGAAHPPKKASAIMRFFKPWQYADYPTLRALVPHDHVEFAQYQESVEADAYFPPSVIDSTPLLWIPEDPVGLSKQEIAQTSRVIPITDEGCTLDEKNNIVWDRTGARPPLWEEKVWY
jgi:hypothetical protein